MGPKRAQGHQAGSPQEEETLGILGVWWPSKKVYRFNFLSGRSGVAPMGRSGEASRDFFRVLGDCSPLMQAWEQDARQGKGCFSLSRREVRGCQLSAGLPDLATSPEALWRLKLLPSPPSPLPPHTAHPAPSPLVTQP